jgi:methylmalonyl-CoA decarboxylase
MSLILTNQEDSIGTIILNNAKKRNCLSNALLVEILEAFESFKEQEVRLVIIRSDNAHEIWSAGFDVDELPEPRRSPLSYEDPLEKVMRKIQEFPGMVLAMVEGRVFGGACELVCTCDLVIGCEKTSFRMTPVMLGVPYNITGILHLTNRVGLTIAKEMLLTAVTMNAERAYKVHLLNYLVRKEDLRTM